MTTQIGTRTKTVVQTIRPGELPRGTGASIYALANSIWPPAMGTDPTPLDEVLSRWKLWEAAHFIVTTNDAHDGDVLAHTLIFRREVFTQQGPISVGALATVCVNPEYRGRGWGADVVRAAFDYLPELGADVSLFQTGVPEFYEKLGARLVDNTFVNGDNPKNPFWDACEMIYPATFDWPDGRIDLNGTGY